MLREAALVVLENRLPDEDDEVATAAEFQMNAAVRCWLLGGLRIAMPLLDLLVDRYPNDPHTQYTAGCFLARQNKMEALPRLERAMELDPLHYRVYAAEARRLIGRLHGP